MSPEAIIGLIGGVIVVITLIVVIIKKLPKKVKTEKFVAQWKELQRFCADKTTWAVAITEADQLFDQALKARRFKGKSMGERMVAAQRSLSDSDGIWFAHNLSKKLVADPTLKLKEADVKAALFSFRQALRDIGVLPSNATQVEEKASGK